MSSAVAATKIAIGFMIAPFFEGLVFVARKFSEQFV